MIQKSKRTPGPCILTNCRLGVFSTNEPVGKNIAIATTDAKARHESENQANAEFIFRAWNSHDELVEALEKIIARLTADCGTGDYSDLCKQQMKTDAIEIATTALKKVRDKK